MTHKTEYEVQLNIKTTVEQPYVRLKPGRSFGGMADANGDPTGETWATFQLCDVETFDSTNIKEETVVLDISIDPDGDLISDLTAAILSKYPPV